MCLLYTNVNTLNSNYLTFRENVVVVQLLLKEIVHKDLLLWYVHSTSPYDVLCSVWL